MKTIKRAFSFPNTSYFLFGPRGTGKSTLLQAHYKDSVYIDLLLSANFLNYSSDPDRLIEIVAANKDKRIIIIDEIQKVPSLLPVVHHVIEKNKNIQFVLTGSSSRKLKTNDINLLGGRALSRHMHPFTAFELGKNFDLQEAIDYGMLPVILSAYDKGEQLDAYINLYLKEEIQMEGLTRNIGNFSRFLESVSFSHGSVLNISNISRDCKVERKVVTSYLGILEDLLLSYRLPVFNKRAKRIVISHQKFYFFDSGVYNFLRPKGPLDSPEEIAGPSLEGLVLQNMYAYLDGIHSDAGVYFWRTKSGIEIDFIVYGKESFYAIEVKNTKKTRKEDLKALASFKIDYPMAKSYFLYRGAEKIKIDEVLVIPVEEFLVHMDKYLSVLPGKDVQR